MPKDEFDSDDPMELNGIGLASEEDTTEPMTECFIEEFMRLGYDAKQILALFRNPHYIGMNMVVHNRGEQFVRDCIVDIFARRGRLVTWAAMDLESARVTSGACAPQEIEHGDALTDPTGSPIPVLNP